MVCTCPAGAQCQNIFGHLPPVITPHVCGQSPLPTYSTVKNNLKGHIFPKLPPSISSKPKAFVLPLNRISPNPLRPHVSSAGRFLHWMTPYGLVRLRHLSQFLPPHVISRERVVLVQAVSTSTLRNYGAGLLRFTQFCDDFNVPESLKMPAPEWLLSIFITTCGAGSVGSGSLKTWLLGLELWHIINSAPWRGAGHLKRATQGARCQAPDNSSRPKCLPVTLAHLK